MTKSLIPDPLKMFREAVNRLESRANAAGTRGLQSGPVLMALHRLSDVVLVLRQAGDAARDDWYRRWNLPSGRDVAELKATLQRIEDQIETLSSAHSPAASKATPSRTRKPPAKPAAAAAPATTTRRRRAAV